MYRIAIHGLLQNTECQYVTKTIITRHDATAPRRQGEPRPSLAFNTEKNFLCRNMFDHKLLFYIFAGNME
jgi:hypothetical protein